MVMLIFAHPDTPDATSIRILACSICALSGCQHPCTSTQGHQGWAGPGPMHGMGTVQRAACKPCMMCALVVAPLVTMCVCNINHWVHAQLWLELAFLAVFCAWPFYGAWAICVWFAMPNPPQACVLPHPPNMQVYQASPPLWQFAPRHKPPKHAVTKGHFLKTTAQPHHSFQILNWPRAGHGASSSMMPQYHICTQQHTTMMSTHHHPMGCQHRTAGQPITLP